MLYLRFAVVMRSYKDEIVDIIHLSMRFLILGYNTVRNNRTVCFVKDKLLGYVKLRFAKNVDDIPVTLPLRWIREDDQSKLILKYS